METVKKRHPDISYSDLWILASYVALEVTTSKWKIYSDMLSDIVTFRNGKIGEIIC